MTGPSGRGQRRVLLLHTGGTLGMQGAPLSPDDFSATLTDRVPEITELASIETRVVCNLDSSDVGPTQWRTLAEIVAAERDSYAGFVIVHGTDTMAYTASALAFALTGLDRPVILTGAQRPLAALRSDARRNLADAVELATLDIPEVGICFDGLLFRGCRATKSHARQYRAFESPGCAPLAHLGVDVDIARVRHPETPFGCDPRFDPRVLVVHVTPGMRPELLASVLDGPSRPAGIVLSAFGVGTVPRASLPLAGIVGEAIADGVEVLVITQAGGGHVDLRLYENSRPLLYAGAIEGGSMRVEAAVPKLMHGLATREDRAERRAYLEADVAGELS